MPALATVAVGTRLDERPHEPSMLSLFLYNAVLWNPHRIHFDESYTTQVEKHPGIVVDGPLQGDWLSQVVTSGSATTVHWWNSSTRTAGPRIWASVCAPAARWSRSTAAPAP